jgi:hypothetical protein
MPKTKSNKQLIAERRNGNTNTVAKQIRRAIKEIKPFETGGTALGAALGQKAGYPGLGAFAGRRIGRFFGEITGLGSYTVKGNAIATTGGATTDVPTFSRDNDSVVVTHREYIGDITSGPVSGQFNVVNFPVNPSSATTFPWLNQLASLYDQWEPMGIVFDYKSTSSNFNAAGQTLGAVIIAPRYDAYDPEFTNKIDMENAQFAVSCRPDQHMLHPVECAPSERTQRSYYVGDNRGIDRRLNTFCIVSVATVGVTPTNVVLGELWVTYKIKLYKPLIFRPLAGLFQTTTIDPSSATNFWGTMTRGQTLLGGYVANIPGISFSTVSAGIGVITFNDPSTWGRAFLICFNTTWGAVASNTTLFYTGNAQAVIVPSFDYRTVANLTTTPAELNAVTVVKIIRDANTTAFPSLRLTSTYILGDLILTGSLTFLELADYGLQN